jgi:hypothetical protein
MKTINDSLLSTITGGATRPLSPEMQRRVDKFLESERNIPDLRGLPATPTAPEPYRQSAPTKQ